MVRAPDGSCHVNTPVKKSPCAPVSGSPDTCAMVHAGSPTPVGSGDCTPCVMTRAWGTKTALPHGLHLCKCGTAGEEVLLLPVKGGQDKPFPAATGTTVPSPPTPQHKSVSLFSQPSQGSIMASDGLSLHAPTDPTPGAELQPSGLHPPRGCAPPRSLPKHDRDVPGKRSGRVPFGKGVTHLPISPLLIAGPPTCSCQHRFAGAGEQLFQCSSKK